MATIAERVAAGADFLNVNDPGWWREDAECAIDLGALDLASPCLCVLGQREGTGSMYAFGDRVEALGLSAPEYTALGFEISDWQATGCRVDAAAEYADLTAEWQRVIADLRATALLAEAEALAAVGAARELAVAR